ncbi:MAG: sporulation protein YqfD [Clostridia bacterium]|nr:sporulation protein YqfD [Clostridia bacterium]
MVSLLRVFGGYTRFCAEGGFPERFLNLCKIEGISLWSIENDGVKVKACTSSREFEKIKTPAIKSGMEIKELESKGFPFFVKRHKWRCGAVLGVIIAVLFVWIMSGCVWEVEVVEEEGVKLDNFTESLAEFGVKTGARKSKIDILDVQEKLLKRYPQLSWVSVNIFGDKVQVEYTPAKTAPELKSENVTSNIIAGKSGKIVLVEGYKGTNAVKEGAYVPKGALLISGVTVNADGSEAFAQASGKVFAQTDNKHSSFEASSSERALTTDAFRRYSLSVFNLEIPLGFYDKTALSWTTDMMLQGDSAVLPVGVIREDSVETQNVKVNLTVSETQLMNLCRCIKEKRSKYTDAEFVKVSFAPKNDGGENALFMEIVCVEDIAEEKIVDVE